MVLCFFGLLWLHETPDWLLENKQFDKAIKSLRFYNVDPKTIVEEDEKRLNKNGENKSYDELVALYRQEYVKHTELVTLNIRNDAPAESWGYIQ